VSAPVVTVAMPAVAMMAVVMTPVDRTCDDYCTVPMAVVVADFVVGEIAACNGDCDYCEYDCDY
jgi:hypothetical protein